MGRVLFVVGARPNFMKVAPVFRALARSAPDLESLVVHTGQHYDREMSDVFLGGLGLPPPASFLNIGSGSHSEQTAAVMMRLEEVLIRQAPDLVVVAGDVNSTLGAALAAAQRAIPCAHIEAGLRSFDPAMPEELNRRLVDQVCAVLLIHSPGAAANLEREGIDAERIHHVGNTMVDSLLDHIDSARRARPWAMFGLEPGGYGLITLHRPELVDDGERLQGAMEELEALTRWIPLLFPVHPRTRERLDVLGLTSRLERMRIVPPLDYETFLGLEAAARFVLTDSGGVQEETTVLGVRCFTLRDSTERPITVEQGTNTVLGIDPVAIAMIPTLLSHKRQPEPIPLWDGRAGERAAKVLATFVEGRAARRFERFADAPRSR